MKILMVTSETVPFAKTGGLADVVGSLTKCIDKQYYDVRVMIPKYSCMSDKMKEKLSRENSVLIVIGYSGNDEHINKILKDCISSGLTIYWFKFKKEDYQSYT